MNTYVISRFFVLTSLVVVGNVFCLQDFTGGVKFVSKNGRPHAFTVGSVLLSNHLSKDAHLTKSVIETAGYYIDSTDKKINKKDVVIHLGANFATRSLIAYLEEEYADRVSEKMTEYLPELINSYAFSVTGAVKAAAPQVVASLTVIVLTEAMNKKYNGGN